MPADLDLDTLNASGKIARTCDIGRRDLAESQPTRGFSRITDSPNPTSRNSGHPRFRPLAAAARGDNVLGLFQGLQKGERKLPDIWTEHPEIVRDLLREAGLTCGVEPRILKGRDPDWTCILDGKNIAGDIYIHQADTILGVGIAAVAFALLGVLLGVVIVLLWQAWVISRLKRTLRGS
jgi:hypothetical protein